MCQETSRSKVNFNKFFKKAIKICTYHFNHVHLNDMYILNGLYANNTSVVAIIPNQTFCLVYHIWQLIYMIQ